MLEQTTFDGVAMFHALEDQRRARGLDWNGLADALHQQSRDLNADLGGNHICPGALGRTAQRGTMSCQYAMLLLRWLGRAPEEFLRVPGAHVGDTRLPTVGPDQRLRWDLPHLYGALDEHRRKQELTWVALAGRLGCTPNRLTNLKNARQADMDLAMRITQFLERPAAEFVGPARW